MVKRPILFFLWLAATVASCDEPEPREAEASPAPRRTADVPDAAVPERRRPSCEQRRRDVEAGLEHTLAPLRRCSWDVDCVVVRPEAGCSWLCPGSVAAAGVVAARAATSTACRDASRDGCDVAADPCEQGETSSCVASVCEARENDEASGGSEDVEIPPQNHPGLEAVPQRPPAGDAEERARRLFEAIVHDDPDRAMDFFFPREVFLVLKGIADPGPYYDRLLERYVRDIHDLHAGTPGLDRAELLRFELARRGGWVGVREEGNRLPYWASRHSRIVYRVDGNERSIEVRVLITWGERWYVTHLSEFH